MGWSGGTFSRVHNFSADASAGIQAQASRFDAEFNEYKAGLEKCWTLDGQNTPTANLSMGGYKLSNTGAATSAGDYTKVSQAYKQSIIYLASTSAASGLFDGLTDGMEITLQKGYFNEFSGTGSTSATNIIISSVTAPILDRNRQPAANSELPNTSREKNKRLVYDASAAAWIDLNPHYSDSAENTAMMMTQADTTASNNSTNMGSWFQVKDQTAILTFGNDAIAMSASVSCRYINIPYGPLPQWLFRNMNVDRALGTIHLDVGGTVHPIRLYWDKSRGTVVGEKFTHTGFAAGSVVTFKANQTISFFIGKTDGNY
ncbi:MAG: hypothetical protein CMI60_12615 [Parvibaculum sp.]|nr:hypothetical protein [Parvibaculum sp.]